MPRSPYARIISAVVASALLGALLSTGPPAGGVAGFGDVPVGRFYTEPVQWMVDNEITTGTSPTCFDPDDPVTRGQAAAFIWRMEGEPAPGPPHKFSDVVSPWQQDPVSWMLNNAVTTGTSPTTYSPDEFLTRGQLAAFLHRLAGEPAAPPPTEFTDVDRSWQITPIGWMVLTGLTTGTSPTTFSPENSATRGQLAAFLHRYSGSPLVTIDESSPSCETIPPGLTTPPPDFKVAFIADQGAGDDARAVLELIRDEGAAMVLHQGDFDYGDDPVGWDNLITDVLGADFPYFASIGNHDDTAWSGGDGYQAKLSERLSKVPGAACVGDLGVRSTCAFGGLYFILSGAGTMGSGHDTYIADQLAEIPSRWRICSWHKNQEAMQVGGKGNSTGWDVYERCREGGAIIATGHEHSYSRTKTLTNVSTQSVDEIWSQPDDLRVGSGSTFVFVSGLGGRSIRDQERCLPTTPPYGCDGEWARVYTSDQDANFGALFCAFNVDGREDKASCYFKDIDGAVPDVFNVINLNQ